MKNNFAILVLSCDKYSSLWKPFFSQFHRYWKHCPYPIYLGNNSKEFRWHGVKTVHSVINEDWSSNLLSILRQIPEENLFIWLDDYFISSRMHEKKFGEAMKFFTENRANHMHMTASVPSRKYSDDTRFGIIDRGAPYRVAAYGFWNKSHLAKLLLSGESVWKFEVFGSYRSSYQDGYFNVKQDLFSFVQIVARGKIIRESLSYCRLHKVPLSVENWEITPVLTMRNQALRIMFGLIIHVPWKIRVACMNLLRKIFASY